MVNLIKIVIYESRDALIGKFASVRLEVAYSRALESKFMIVGWIKSPCTSDLSYKVCFKSTYDSITQSMFGVS